MFQLLCFDLDDTLWPCMPTIEYAEQAIYDWLERHKPHISQRYSIEQLREKRKQLIHQQPDLLNDLSEARRVHLRQLAAEFNDSDDWIETAFEVFYQARQKVEFYPDVIPVLTRLRTHYRLVALTNGNAHISQTGLQPFFEFQVSAADVQAAKPHPAMFERAMQRAGVGPEQTLHIGDHPRHDIRGARNAGIQAAWLRRTDQPWDLEESPPELQFDNLFQLQHWLIPQDRGDGFNI